MKGISFITKRNKWIPTINSQYSQFTSELEVAPALSVSFFYISFSFRSLWKPELFLSKQTKTNEKASLIDRISTPFIQKWCSWEVLVIRETSDVLFYLVTEQRRQWAQARAAAQGEWWVQNSRTFCCSERRHPIEWLRNGVQRWWQKRAKYSVLRLTSW